MTNSLACCKIDTRSALIKLIGAGYEKNARGPDKFDCWHLAVYVQYHIYNRRAPSVDIPTNANWKWMIDQFTTHPELGNWIEHLQPNNGLVNALDGAMVLMSRSQHPAHCGVWIENERAIIHCDDPGGVMLQSRADLKMQGWTRLRFYSPR